MAFAEACAALFARYPLAVETDGDGQDEVSLAVPGDKPRFYVVTRLGPGEFEVGPWQPGGAGEHIGPETASVPEEYAQALTGGVPLPRDGSMLGWVSDGEVTALVLSCTRCSPAARQPSFSVMPLAGGTQDRWPPFTAEPCLGASFWGHYGAGRVVDLAPLAGSTRGTVFWVPAALPGAGAGVIAVAEPLRRGPSRWVLPSGVYVYYGALAAAPALAEVLADPGKTDLGPRFAPPAPGPARMTGRHR